MKRKSVSRGKLFLFHGLAGMLLLCSVPVWSMRSVSRNYLSAVFVSPLKAGKIPVSRNDVYDSLHLADFGLSKAAFQQGLAGLDLLVSSGDIHNAGILSIADLSLPSSKKRLFVIDLNTCQLIFNTYVSHGRNSGKEMATRFSNNPRSCESSLGFYVTGDTYRGHHGYSLKLKGEEEGINDNAFSRGIVIHSASYVNERIAKSQGFIGRSEGCPAIPKNLHKKIIEKIKNGTCLFLYSPDKYYESHSKMRQAATS